MGPKRPGGGESTVKARPVAHVLCGFIGAGKTTFARKLEGDTGAVRITKDEWLIRLIGTDPTIDGYAELDRNVCQLSQDFAFYLLGKGIDVILDEGFWARDERAALRNKIRTSGGEDVLYFVDTPIDAIRERVAERNLHLSADSFKISRELLDSYLQYWQPPGEDEEYVLVRHEE